MKTCRHHLLVLVACGCAWGHLAAAPAPAVDPARIIRESGSLIKRPEPEMTASEEAIHEKIAPILSKRPAFALKILRAMSGTSGAGDEKPSPAFEFMMGNAFYAVGDFAMAEGKFRSATDRNADFLRAWNNLGVLYYVQDRHAEAVPCFSNAVALGDRESTTFGLLGTSLEKVGNTVSAETAYMQALAGDPANINWTEGLLRLYFADKQMGKAETMALTLLRAHPGEAKYNLTYVNLLLSTHRELEAISVLQRMSATGLAREEDVAHLADLYAEQQMIPEALATLDRLAASQPEIAGQRLLRLARILIGGRHWTRAATVLEALSGVSLSNSGRIAYLEAKVELELAREDWIAAKRELATLLTEAPSNGNAWIGLGRVHLAEKEEGAALTAFERAYQIPESAYRASIELANITCKNRHYAQCLGYLDHALSIQRTPAVENFRSQIRNLVPPERIPTP